MVLSAADKDVASLLQQELDFGATVRAWRTDASPLVPA